MNKVKIGDKIRIVGSSRIHHHLAVPSVAEIIEIDPNDFKVSGHDSRGVMLEQWVSIIDTAPIRKAVIK